VSDDDALIVKRLLRNEELLLKAKTELSPAQLGDLIGEDCIDFSEPGKAVKFAPEVLSGVAEGELYIVSNTVKMVTLAPDCRLFLYVVGAVIKNSRKKANRSSIWRNDGGKWKVVFRQQTAWAD